MESDIRVLQLMIKHYEERGGGHSQKEALKKSISVLKAYQTAGEMLPKIEPNKTPKQYKIPSNPDYIEGFVYGRLTILDEAKPVVAKLLQEKEEANKTAMTNYKVTIQQEKEISKLQTELKELKENCVKCNVQQWKRKYGELKQRASVEGILEILGEFGHEFCKENIAQKLSNWLKGE